jgi:hypothetical protein
MQPYQAGLFDRIMIAPAFPLIYVKTSPIVAWDLLVDWNTPRPKEA